MAEAGTLATMLAAGAAAYAAAHLGFAVTLPDPEATASALPAPPAEAEADGDNAAPRSWPAVFGTPPPRDAPAPDAEPEISTDYVLKGLIAGGEGGWAILGSGDTELLVRPGDTLEDGATVTAIDRGGVTLEAGTRRLRVVFGEADLSSVAAPAATTPVPEGGPVRVEEVALDVADLDRRDFRRMLARGGAVASVALEDGTQVLEVSWVRNGQLYDRLGLRAGDRVLTINGISAGDNEALMKAAGTLLQTDSYRLEIIRNDQRQDIEVTLEKDD